MQTDFGRDLDLGCAAEERPAASTDRGESHGDDDGVRLEQTTLDDAGGADAIDQSEGNPGIDVPADDGSTDAKVDGDEMPSPSDELQAVNRGEPSRAWQSPTHAGTYAPERGSDAPSDVTGDTDTLVGGGAGFVHQTGVAHGSDCLPRAMAFKGAGDTNGPVIKTDKATALKAVDAVCDAGGPADADSPQPRTLGGRPEGYEACGGEPHEDNDEGGNGRGTELMTLPKRGRGKLGAGLTTSVMSASRSPASAADTMEMGGQPDSDSLPAADNPEGSSGEAEAPSEVIDKAEESPPAVTADTPRSTGTLGADEALFKANKITVVDANDFHDPLNLNAYEDMFSKASAEDDGVLEAQVQTVDEVIVDITPEGRGLDKVRTYRAANKLGKRIKFRVHHGLSPTTERETRYRLNDGGRQPSEEDRQRVRRERLWNLFRFRNDLNECLTYDAIARLTGYSVSWISKLDEEFLASNSSTSGEAVKRNLNRKKTPELVGKAKALLAEGTSIKDIARELGVHENSIRNWLKEPDPNAGAKHPKLPKSAASGNSPTTSRRSQSIEPPVVPSDVDFDEDGFVAKALERCGVTKSEKGAWQLAGRRLLDERLRNFSNDDREVLKSAARARVEFRAAADAAEQQLKELLHKIPEVA